ncbi:TonB-dependent receptor [Sphingobacterium olei]|uniref:TonB-dependent receptor n=1 Tax=Sphingobacterium olei TaxID=2571155 RepID=A0A4U0NYT4_9SPHI|nr:TonB-dependent receptor [Sphingobacterium olei]TJZ60041.1 TonB-dependent receptor [Sphingobacterium olei]
MNWRLMNNHAQSILPTLGRKYCCQILLLWMLSLMIFQANAQSRTIKGILKNELGEPIEGVTIAVKGTALVASTNTDGRFSLDVLSAESAVLVFTYVGYVTREITVRNQNELEVILVAESGNLEEVVVLGFGQSQKKIAQTGSIASISSKQLKQSPVANITNALAGRLPGLIAMQRSGQPGNDMPYLFIRGRASLNNSSPLVTIDGIQKDYQSISLLDPNEVENITILKDASATALYGVKGANGVIIVTTKRGSASQPIINASVEQAIQEVVRVPKFLDSYNHALLANEAYFNDNPHATSPLYSAEALEAYRTGSNPLLYPNVDWMDEMLKNGLQSKVNFNISGGAKKVKYFVNVGYLDQGGIYKAEKNKDYDPNANFKRYNFRSNVDIDFDDDFSMGLSLFGAIEDKNRPFYTDADIFYTLLVVPPNEFPIKYPNGRYGARSGGQNNAFWILNDWGYVEEYNSSLSGMLSLARKLNFITEGLTLKGNYSFDGYFRNSFVRQKLTIRSQYKGTGPFEEDSSYDLIGTEMPLTAPSSSFVQNRDVWIDMSLNYQRKFGDHELTGLLLANRTQKVIANQVPFVSQGLVGRFVYNYKNKYFGELNAGYNGTDNFAKDLRYGFFPAVSAGWVLSEENFLKDNRVVNYLKLRGSYGLTGNDQLGGRRWLFISEYQNSTGYLFGNSLTHIGGITEGAMANPDVSWEKSKKANIGLETQFFNNVFGLTLDLFKENRYDILITRNTVPSILGVPSGNLPPVNMGKVDNRGFEVELSHRYKIGNVNYFLNANGSLAKNKILFMDEATPDYPWLARTDHPIGQLYGLTSLGFFNSQEEIDNSPTQFGNVIPGDIKYKDLNDDGVIDGNDEGAIGRSTVPEVFFGFAGGFTWNKLDMSFLFQGAANANRQPVSVGYYEFYGGGKATPYHQGRWTPETASTATYPALHYGGNSNNHRASTFYMDNTSYIRLKNVEIGYTFENVALFKNRSFKTLRLYSTAMNLFTWTEAKLLDPENDNGYGAVHPPMRIFNFGLSVNF